MSHFFKRTISLLVALVLLFTPLLSVIANAADYKANCPYIFVHGFMGTDIYVDPDDPDSKTAWPPDGDAIKTAVKEALPHLLKFIFFRNHKELGDKLFPIADKLFAPIYLDDDGNVPNKSGVRFEYPVKESIKKTSQLSFVYDWRLTPMETAAKLNDFIDYVLEASGSEQVVIECHSYGGVICNTYARLYGTSKVRSWLFNSTAVYGETYTGDLMLGKMAFNADAITAYLIGAVDYNKNDSGLIALFNALKISGLTGVICTMFNHILLEIGPQPIAEALLKLFGRWHGIWAMIPDEMIDEAYDYIFNDIYKNDPTDRSFMQGKIKDYNENIRAYKADTMKLINDTSNLYIVSRYGYSAFFLTPSWQNASDMIIDVKYNSYGATAADYGKTLTDEQMKGVDSKYISPDKTVNASTCMFPEQTWFVRHISHGTYPDSIKRMDKILLYYDGQATVDTFSDFPRFLYFDEDTKLIVPDTLYDVKLSLKDKFKKNK